MAGTFFYDEITERIYKHISKHKGFTGWPGGWKLVYPETCIKF